MTDRDLMLDFIDQMASDDDMLKLCSILRRNLVEDRLTHEMLATFEKPTHAPPLVDLTTSTVEHKNINPGPSAIGKIGSTTKAELLHILSCGAQPTAKYKEHLKLLWARDEVKWDGEVWYV